eukprot:Platyproteum_vivax@DN615_c0_g1_i1.p1
MGTCCSDERKHKDDMKMALDNRTVDGSKNVDSEAVMAEPSQRAYGSRSKQGYTSVEQPKLKGDQPGDVKLFDAAFASNDIQAFVNLLDSKQKIEKMQDRMHPWAVNPRTVGALAATQLAIIVSQQNAPDDIKDKIRFAGAIPKLVNFLRSQEEDRIHAAIVALSFLSDESEANGREMKSKDVMSLLIPHLKSPIEGMRSTTASCLRNIYVLEVDWRKEFVKEGGVEPLLKLLEFPANSPANAKYDSQYEALLNVEDLLIDSQTDTVVQDVGRAMAKAGAYQVIKALLKVNDEGIQEVGNEVLERMASYVPASLQE